MKCIVYNEMCYVHVHVHRGVKDYVNVSPIDVFPLKA